MSRWLAVVQGLLQGIQLEVCVHAAADPLVGSLSICKGQFSVGVNMRGQPGQHTGADVRGLHRAGIFTDTHAPCRLNRAGRWL
jgi:hypothetical protein